MCDTSLNTEAKENTSTDLDLNSLVFNSMSELGLPDNFFNIVLEIASRSAHASRQRCIYVCQNLKDDACDTGFVSTYDAAEALQNPPKINQQGENHERN